MALLVVAAIGQPVWADCQAFLDTYNQNPGNADNDKVLADAAACFQRDKSVSAALQADSLLIKYYPNSKLASAAIQQAGRLYEQVAMFDRAADKYEDYAKRYLGEKDAAGILGDAIRLRAALGDRAKQIEDTKYWIRTFGAKRKAEAAEYALSLVAVFDGDDAIAQLRAVLKDYEAVAPELAITAHVELADRLRAKSCPVHAVAGLCVKVVPVRGPHCGPATTSVVAVKRTADHGEALAEYRAAIAVTAKATEPAARHARAMARLALADDDLEGLIAAQLPQDLDMTRPPDRKRFAQWLDAEIKLGERITTADSAVLMDKDATSSVAATARIGEAAQAMWRALVTSEVPKAMRAPELRTAYCDQMKIAADPLRARAIEVAWTCIAKAAELQAGQDWADACWRDGSELEPERFAPIHELHDPPGGFAAPIVLEPAL